MEFHQPPSTNDFDNSPYSYATSKFDAYLWNDEL